MLGLVYIVEIHQYNVLKLKLLEVIQKGVSVLSSVPSYAESSSQAALRAREEGIRAGFQELIINN